MTKEPYFGTVFYEKNIFLFGKEIVGSDDIVTFVVGWAFNLAFWALAVLAWMNGIWAASLALAVLMGFNGLMLTCKTYGKKGTISMSRRHYTGPRDFWRKGG